MFYKCNVFKYIFIEPDFSVTILSTIFKSKHKILSVYTQNPKKSRRGQKINKSPVHKLSQELGLAIRHPDQLEDIKEIEYIKKLNPDVVVIVAYGKILPSKILEIGNIKFINIHASLLPKWRGAAPIQRSIIEMDHETGISIMKVVPELDAGPFLIQEKIKIDKYDNYISLSQKLSLLGSKLILKSFDLIESNNFNLTNQNHDEATYAKKIKKSEAEIDWNIPAKNLIAKINGLSLSGVRFKHKTQD